MLDEKGSLATSLWQETFSEHNKYKTTQRFATNETNSAPLRFNSILSSSSDRCSQPVWGFNIVHTISMCPVYTPFVIDDPTLFVCSSVSVGAGMADLPTDQLMRLLNLNDAASFQSHRRSNIVLIWSSHGRNRIGKWSSRV